MKKTKNYLSKVRIETEAVDIEALVIIEKSIEKVS